MSSDGLKEEEDQTEDRERLGEGEAQDRDRAQQVRCFRLTSDAIDVGGEDQADGDGRADGREAVANEGDVTFHVTSLSVCLSRRRRPPAARVFSCRTVSSESVFVCESPTDVGGGQEHEDVGLKELDQRFEEHHEKRHPPGWEGDQREESALGEEFPRA